jgi:hypothetical protein
MNVGSALKLSCVGVLGGIVLRLVAMLFFFDYSTGFFIDGGIVSWVAVLFDSAISIIAAVWCVRDHASRFGAYEMKKDVITGVLTLLAVNALTITAVLQIKRHVNMVQQGQVGREHPQSTPVHLIFVVATTVFLLLLFITAMSSFTGRNVFARMKLMHLFSVLWGIVNLLFVFSYYAKSAIMAENMYMILGGSFLLFTLLYMSKMVAGLGGEKTAKNCYLMGIPAVIITLSYVVSNLILNALDIEYYSFGEIPIVIQIGYLGISVYIFTFLFTFKKNNVTKKHRFEIEPRYRYRIPAHKGKKLHIG